MESLLSSGHLALNNRVPVITSHFTMLGLPIRPRSFSISSKKSAFQDFQEYVKPRRLLPTRGLERVGKDAPDKLISSDGSQSLYKVLVRTSSIYGSGISDMNAGVLICIIDEHGDSILERIPAILCQDHTHTQHTEESNEMDHVHFDRGSVDEFMLCGPKLGRIQAMWISLESGNWRLGGASLTSLSINSRQAEEGSASGDVYRSVTYKFEGEDIMVGEGSETPMAELRPCQVTEYNVKDPFAIPDIKAPSLAQRKKMNEDSMREYADLKYSQLLYDSMLILAGTSISSIAGGEDTAVAFFIGGVGGFLYLVLLQRFVDKLPSTDNTSKLGAAKGVLPLAFALGVGVVIVKYDFQPGLAPTDILLAMLGFLASKVALVLSALKPLSMSLWSMASSSLTILSSLILTIFTFLGSQQQAAATSIYEILPQYGIPSGVIPDTVKSYTFNPEDGRLQVELDEQPCYVQLDKYLISYQQRISGTLRLGSITNLKGVQMKRMLFWVDVDEINVDLPPNHLIYFQVGLVNKKLDLHLFHTLPSCTSRKRLLNKVLAWGNEIVDK